jgi:hypothetical protein
MIAHNTAFAVVAAGSHHLINFDAASARQAACLGLNRGLIQRGSDFGRVSASLFLPGKFAHHFSAIVKKLQDRLPIGLDLEQNPDLTVAIAQA